MLEVVDTYRGGMKVTDEQAAIVDHVLARRQGATNRLTVVDAGAGSGKTYTTVATVLELLEQDSTASLDQFVLITFTRKAADELKQRMERALLQRQQQATDDVGRRRWADARERLASAYVGTIHGFCRWILRTFGYGAFVARQADVDLSSGGMLYEAIADTMEEQARLEPDHPLLAEVGQAYQSYHLESLVKEIYDDIRNRGLSTANVVSFTAAQANDRGKHARVAAAKLVQQVHEAYSRRKREADRVDAADLLAKTAELLQVAQADEVGLLKKIASRFRWMCLDEFQDTDRVQEQIVEALLPHMAGVLLVGDVKQSIYGFRGAGLELAMIAKRHGVSVLPLRISRRPTRQLLDLQNRLFESVGKRYPSLDRPLHPSDKPVESTSCLPPMQYVHAKDDASGAHATACLLRELLANPPLINIGPHKVRHLEAGDIALLFRSNQTMDRYEQELSKWLAGDVSVRREEGGSFFRRPEILAAYRLFRIVLDFPNEIALSQALRTPYLHAAHPGAAEQRVLQYGSVNHDDLTRWFANAHRDTEGKIRDLQAAVRSDTVPELLEKLYRTFAVREYHRSRGERREIDNIERLREMARMLNDSEQSLTARVFLRWLQARLLSGFDEPEAGSEGENGIDAGESRPGHVRMMTVHKAKGLEFPLVVIPEVQAPVVSSASDAARFVVGDFGLDLRLKLSSGPTASPQFTTRTGLDDDAQRREAMRVFYVAVTRAGNSVVFVGAGDASIARAMSHPKYSWKDEIMSAWATLEGAGAVRSSQSG